MYKFHIVHDAHGFGYRLEAIQIVIDIMLMDDRCYCSRTFFGELFCIQVFMYCADAGEQVDPKVATSITYILGGSVSCSLNRNL